MLWLDVFVSGGFGVWWGAELELLRASQMCGFGGKFVMGFEFFLVSCLWFCCVFL